MKAINKKGEEPVKPNLIEMVVSIIGILILGLLALKLISIALDSDNKNAGQFFNSLTEKIDALEDGQNNTFTLQGFSTDWVILGFDSGQGLKPEECLDKGCLCVCEKKDNSFDCDNGGLCKKIDKEKVEVLSKTKDSSVGCIFLIKSLMGINVIKEAGFIKISFDYNKIDDTAYSKVINNLDLCRKIPA